jgi:hypothetical protein
MPKDINPSSFLWAKASPAYELAGKTASFKAGGQDRHRPVVGDLAMPPNTGKYFYEIYLNCDNSRVGLAFDDVNLDAELGKDPSAIAVNLQTGAVECGGVEKKRLWRLVTPVSGGHFGFVYDSSAGTLQLYLNEEFHGTAVHEAFNVKGRTVYPCVALGGVELHNRDIGVGKKVAIISQDPQPYRTIV